MTFRPVKPRDYGTVKSCVVDLFRQRGGVKIVRELLGLRSDSTAYALTDENEQADISFARVAMLSQPGAPAAAEYLAHRCGGVFLPVAPEVADMPTLCADDARSHGEAMAAAIKALHGGKLKNGAAKDALEKIDANLRALVALRAVVAQEADTPR